MAFLTLNGWTLPVATWAEQPLFIGGTDRMTYSGRSIKVRRGIRRKFAVKTQLMTAVDAWTLRRLLLWEGHTWSWDVDYFSARGLYPNVAPSLSYDNAVVKYGTQALAASGTCTNSYIAYDFSLADGWTVMLWAQRPANGSTLRVASQVTMPAALDSAGMAQIQYTAGNALQGYIYSTTGAGSTLGGTSGIAAGWHHLALAYDQPSQAVTLYLDGALVGSGAYPSGTAFNNTAAAANVPKVSWGSAGSTNVWGGQIDDCVFLPMRASPAYIAAVAANTAPHGPFPEVVVSGTCIPDTSLLCVPSEVQLTRTAAYLGGAFATTQASVEFSLTEVS